MRGACSSATPQVHRVRRTPASEHKPSSAQLSMTMTPACLIPLHASVTLSLPRIITLIPSLPHSPANPARTRSKAMLVRNSQPSPSLPAPYQLAIYQTCISFLHFSTTYVQSHLQFQSRVLIALEAYTSFSRAGSQRTSVDQSYRLLAFCPRAGRSDPRPFPPDLPLAASAPPSPQTLAPCLFCHSRSPVRP